MKRKKQIRYAFISLLIAVGVTSLILAGCSFLKDDSSSPTGPAFDQQSQTAGSENGSAFETVGSADNFGVMNSADPFALVEYYGQQHDDMVQFILHCNTTVSEIEAMAVEFPSIYFGQDLPDHNGWSLDSLAIMNLTIAELEYQLNAIVNEGLISQTFANDVLATMNQLSSALGQAIDQNDFSCTDQIVEDFVSRCPNYSPYLELGLIGVLKHSYYHAKEKGLFYKNLPGNDDLWVILGDVAGYVGGVAITKTNVDGTAGAAIGSAIVEFIEDLLD